MRFTCALLGPASWFVALILIWELASRTGLADPLIVSQPSAIVASWVQQVHAGFFSRDLFATLQEFAAGYLLAAVSGILLGFLSGWYRRLRFSIGPLMWFLYNAPLVAFYPLLIVWLGLGSPTIIALAFLLAFFPIYTNTLTGMMLVNPVLISCARSFGAGVSKIFLHVALPATVPAVVAGLRLGVGRALVGTVVGELIGGHAGLGYRMAYAANHFNTTLYFVAFVATAIVGLALTDILRRCEARLRRFHSI